MRGSFDNLAGGGILIAMNGTAWMNCYVVLAQRRAVVVVAPSVMRDHILE
jgi:hypothetical protein